MLYLIATATLRSTSPYSQSKPIHGDAKTRAEDGDAYESRVWQKRIHTDPESGRVVVPGSQIKQALSACCRYRGERVPGKGAATWSKHFDAGIMIPDDIQTDIPVERVECEDLFAPASGIRGDGKRVWKKYPLIRQWSGEVRINIMDPLLTTKPEVVKEHLEFAGMFIGIGRWRPINWGKYGRFVVETWKVEKFGS